MSTVVSAGREIPGPPVAFNTQDWWVRGKGLFEASSVIVGTIFGEVFENVIENTGIKPAVKYSGARMALNRPMDRWVISENRTFLVGLADGRVFLHSVRALPGDIQPAVKLSGPPVAARPPDKHVLMVGHQGGFDIVVILHDGGVFVHRLTSSGGSAPVIGSAVKATGPPVAFNTVDRWVITGRVNPNNPRQEIFVINSDGAVFSHPYNANPGGVPSVGAANKLTGPPVASNAHDRWVLMSGGRIVVITDRGKVFLHDVS